MKGLLIYYFCLIMYSFEVQKIPLNVVSDDDIDAMQESYFEMLDSYF